MENENITMEEIEKAERQMMERQMEEFFETDNYEYHHEHQYDEL